MSWTEDAVSFRAVIRCSGNSLVITIPVELSQRFLLKEGQELLIYGLSRSGPDFEGSLQVYLGYFIVHEKASALIMRIDVGDKSLRRLQEIVDEVCRKHFSSRMGLRMLSKSQAEIEFVFGAITPIAIRRLREMSEVEAAASELEFTFSSAGFKVLEKRIEEKIVEWEGHRSCEALEGAIQGFRGH